MKAIEVENLTYSYPEGKKALDNITFNVDEGEIVGLIGANGAGKTTLLMTLVGILKHEGIIKIFGTLLSKKTVKKIRKEVGIVFQNPDLQLFCPTVFDDVAFGPINLGLPKDEVLKRVKVALNSVGLEGFENRTSHHLSTGEKKRVAIATVLSMMPKILLLDEPTSNLDPRARRELIKLLKSFNMTMLIASHDLDMIKTLCTKVIFLYQGKVVASAPPNEILDDTELLLNNGL